MPPFLNTSQLHEPPLRCHEDPPIHHSPYRQPHFSADGCSLEIYARQLLAPTGLWLEREKTHEFSSAGEWVDGTLACGLEGTRDGNFELAELATSPARCLAR